LYFDCLYNQLYLRLRVKGFGAQNKLQLKGLANNIAIHPKTIHTIEVLSDLFKNNLLIECHLSHKKGK